jgi:putative ABC transport system ATP-binding protein
MALFDELHADGQTIVVVTHEPDVAAHGQRIVRLKDGKVVEDRRSERGGTEH